MCGNGSRSRWCDDITYINTWEGWLYLATVIDLSSHRVAGWATADHLRTDLVDQALRNAIHARRPESGVIFHSEGWYNTRRRHSGLGCLSPALLLCSPWPQTPRDFRCSPSLVFNKYKTPDHVTALLRAQWASTTTSCHCSTQLRPSATLLDEPPATRPRQEHRSAEFRPYGCWDQPPSDPSTTTAVGAVSATPSGADAH